MLFCRHERLLNGQEETGGKQVKKTQNKHFLLVIFKKWRASNGSKKMNVNLGFFSLPGGNTSQREEDEKTHMELRVKIIQWGKKLPILLFALNVV